MAPYIPESCAAALRSYKYDGCDNSFMYRYVCSPLAEALVRHCVPMWIAPNLITCLGLIPSLLAHSLIWFYCHGLVSKCPSWCWIVVGLCCLIYQTLDNMDGKQARRTGTSSALGLALDHGVDALNINLTALNVMALFQTGNSHGQCLAIWLISAIPFFFATWEEYHTGILHLGVFNGPTDGVLIASMVFVISGCSEDYASLWNAEFAFGFARKDAMILFYGVCVFFTVFGNLAAVAQFLNRHKGRASMWSECKGALVLTLPFCSVGLAIAIQIVLSKQRGLHHQSPRTMIWVCGLLFQKLVVRLQLAHICAERYNPWREPLWFLPLLCTGNSAIGSPIDENIFLMACVLLLALTWVHMTFTVVRQMARILEIDVFRIGKDVRARD